MPYWSSARESGAHSAVVHYVYKVAVGVRVKVSVRVRFLAIRLGVLITVVIL